VSADLNSGVLAPVAEEVTACSLAVSGHIPDALQGTLIRNGPNPFSGQFSGSGVTDWWPEAAMLHAVQFVDGTANYRNRWVRTESYHEFFAQPGHSGVAGNPNVNVIQHNRHLLALAEGGPSVLINDRLDTLGLARQPQFPWPGETAHPKIDAQTGDFITFRADWAEPYLRYGLFNAEGETVVDCVVEQATPVMMHDMAITRRYSILLDLGVGYDFSMLNRGHRMPLRWRPEKACQLVILPRHGGVATRVDISPCFIQHVVNAYEPQAGVLILDAVRYPHYFLLDTGTDQYHPHPLGHLWRYHINLVDGSVRETQLYDHPVELPRINESRVGHHHRYAYLAAQPSDAEMRGIVRFDFDTETHRTFAVPSGDQNSEPVFVPRPGSSAEDDGWVLAVVYRGAENRSDVIILDAADLDAEPVATVHIRGRIPAGFHGAWVPA